MTLANSSPMMIKHDCVWSKGLTYGHRIWQRTYRAAETITVIIMLGQFSRLQLHANDAIHQYFIRAQELIIQLRQAGLELLKTLFDAIDLNGLPQRCKHLVA